MRSSVNKYSSLYPHHAAQAPWYPHPQRPLAVPAPTGHYTGPVYPEDTRLCLLVPPAPHNASSAPTSASSAPPSASSAPPDYFLTYQQATDARLAKLTLSQEELVAENTRLRLQLAKPTGHATRASADVPPELMSRQKYLADKRSRSESHGEGASQTPRRQPKPREVPNGPKVSALFSKAERYLLLDAMEREKENHPLAGGKDCRRQYFMAVVSRMNDPVVKDRIANMPPQAVANMLSYWQKPSGWVGLEAARLSYRKSMFGCGADEALQLEDAARTTLTGQELVDRLAEIAVKKDPYGVREAVRVVCRRLEERGLLWSLQIAWAHIVESPEWEAAKGRFALKYPNGELNLSRYVIWDELRNPRGTNPETYVFRKPPKPEVTDLKLWKQRLEVEIAYIQSVARIPLWGSYNADETACRMHPQASRQWCLKAGMPRAEIRATSAFTTVLMGNSASGTLLKPQVNFRGKTASCLAPANPDVIQFASEKSHWSTVESIFNWIDKALIPDFKKKRDEEKAITPAGQEYVEPRWMLLLDHAPVHKSEEFRSRFHRRYGKQGFLVFIPPNCTSKLQPMDQGTMFGTFKPRLKVLQAIDVTKGQAQYAPSVHWHLPRVKESLVKCIAEAFRELVRKETQKPVPPGAKHASWNGFEIQKSPNSRRQAHDMVMDDDVRLRSGLFVFGLPGQEPLKASEAGQRGAFDRIEVDEWDCDELNDDGKPIEGEEREQLAVITGTQIEVLDELDDIDGDG